MYGGSPSDAIAVAPESRLPIFSARVIREMASATLASMPSVGSHHGIFEKVEVGSMHGFCSIATVRTSRQRSPLNAVCIDLIRPVAMS